MIKNQIIFNDASDWAFDLVKAEGSFLWTKDGQKLIDFTSGWNVTNLGWNNPEITEAVINQAHVNNHTILWSSDNIQVKYAEALTKALPKSLDTIARATGGTEANEEALKTARAFTGRKTIIGYGDTYHGQSFGAMAIGYRPQYVTAIAPLVPDFIQLEFPRTRKDKSPEEILKDFANELESVLDKGTVAAMVTEAGIISGWGSTYLAPKGYLTLVRELTKKYGTLLILDEVGTGFSRLGKLFGMDFENVVPDIVTFAKGCCNGAGAIGTMVTTKEIAEATVGKTNLTSTFGWNPLSCAAALKTLEIHQRDKVWEKSERDGRYLLETLKTKLLGHPKVGDVRGIGMEVGLEMVKGNNSLEPDNEAGKAVVKKAYENGLHLILGDGGNIQIMPPLTINRAILDEGIEILTKVVSSLN